jgi:hypothetical protein
VAEGPSLGHQLAESTAELIVGYCQKDSG